MLVDFNIMFFVADTRPLLCFNADTVPIRALKWAPLAWSANKQNINPCTRLILNIFLIYNYVNICSDPETANTIVTAGHKGLKFWDIRLVCKHCTWWCHVSNLIKRHIAKYANIGFKYFIAVTHFILFGIYLLKKS